MRVLVSVMTLRLPNRTKFRGFLGEASSAPSHTAATGTEKRLRVRVPRQRPRQPGPRVTACPSEAAAPRREPGPLRLARPRRHPRRYHPG
jgi:hypothetical protein